MPIEQQPPEVLALVIADHVHQDDMNGKFFILGTRSLIAASELPWSQTTLAVYVALTDGRGETEVKVSLIDTAEAREPVFEAETVVNFSDPIVEVELVFFLDELSFPEPGEYRLQLHAAGQLLRERRLAVVLLEENDELSDGQ